MADRYLSITTTSLMIFLASVDPAWAVQAHGGAEGLVVHQVGHVLFTIGMAYLLYRLRPLSQKGPGWAEFRTFLWLLIAWNLTTFTGHWMNEFVPAEQFVKDHASTLFFKVESIPDAIYFLTRLDHVILVPAFAFLLLALNRWRQQP